MGTSTFRCSRKHSGSITHPARCATGGVGSSNLLATALGDPTPPPSTVSGDSALEAMELASEAQDATLIVTGDTDYDVNAVAERTGFSLNIQAASPPRTAVPVNLRTP